jgi:hypothetical protein
MNETERQFWENVFFRSFDQATTTAVAAIHSKSDVKTPSISAAADAADAALQRMRGVSKPA